MPLAKYHAVEPENRLVARELERRWEQCIHEQQVMKEEYERFHEQRPAELRDVQRDQIRARPTDVPALWRSGECSQKDRQDIIRHLVDKIMVNSSAGSPILEVAIHFAGGFISRHELRRPVGCWDLRHRVRAGVLLRLIGKWLNAGVMESGNVSYPESGSPQSGVISPPRATTRLQGDPQTHGRSRRLNR